MRKLMLAILICISINSPTIATAQTNIMTEGMYEIKYLKNVPKIVANVSSKGASQNMTVIVFDENKKPIQFITLPPNSTKYNLVPLQNEYELVIVGKGEVFVE